MAAPHMTGSLATLKLFVADTEVASLDVERWRISRNVTKIDDGVCGEDRDRLDVIVNSYSISLTVFSRDAEKIARLIANQAQADTGAEPESVAFALVLKPRGGAKAAISATECTLDDWSFGADGRTARVMTDIPIRARYVDTVNV